MSPTLPEQLRKAIEFDWEMAHEISCKTSAVYFLGNSTENSYAGETFRIGIRDGQRLESERLRPILLAMIEYYEETERMQIATSCDCYFNCLDRCLHNIVRLARAKLTQALEGR